MISFVWLSRSSMNVHPSLRRAGAILWSSVVTARPSFGQSLASRALSSAGASCLRSSAEVPWNADVMHSWILTASGLPDRPSAARSTLRPM